MSRQRKPVDLIALMNWRRAGWTIEAIAMELKVSRNLVEKRLREMGLTNPRNDFGGAESPDNLARWRLMGPFD